MHHFIIGVHILGGFGLAKALSQVRTHDGMMRSILECLLLHFSVIFLALFSTHVIQSGHNLWLLL